MMRAFADIVENLTNRIRFIVSAIVLGIMAYGLFISIGAAYLRIKAANSIDEGVERLGQERIRAEHEARRARELAKDGWNYRGAARDGKPVPPARESESAKNGWGD